MTHASATPIGIQMRQTGSDDRPAGQYDADRQMWVSDGQPSHLMRQYTYTVCGQAKDD